VYTYNTISDCAREGLGFGIVLTDEGWGDQDYSLAAILGNLQAVTSYLGTNTIVGRTTVPRGFFRQPICRSPFTTTATRRPA